MVTSGATRGDTTGASWDKSVADPHITVQRLSPILLRRRARVRVFAEAAERGVSFERGEGKLLRLERFAGRALRPGWRGKRQRQEGEEEDRENFALHGDGFLSDWGNKRGDPLRQWCRARRPW